MKIIVKTSDLRPCLKEISENKLLVEKILNSAIQKTKIIKQKKMTKWIETKQ